MDANLFHCAARKESRHMDEKAHDATEPLPEGQAADAAPAQGEGAPKKTAAEYAETFNKAVDVAEQVLRFAPLPAGAKRCLLYTSRCV